MGYVVTVVVSLVLGFIAGLSTFQRSQRWCPSCGSGLFCMHCAGQPTPRRVRESLRQEMTPDDEPPVR
jgi:hypothetical protein